MKPVPYSGDCRGCMKNMHFTLRDYTEQNPPPEVRVRCAKCDKTNSLEKDL